MRTIHTSMSNTFYFEFIASFELKTLTILTLKWSSHGYVCCPHKFVKKSITSKQWSCSADFWPILSRDLSWNFKVLQWILLKVSDIILYSLKIMWRDFKKKSFDVVSEIYKKALRVQSLNEVALRQVVRKRVSF